MKYLIVNKRTFHESNVSLEELVDIVEEGGFFINNNIVIRNNEGRTVRDIVNLEEYADFLSTNERLVWRDSLPDNNAKTIASTNKLPTDGVPPIALAALGLAMDTGVKKYGRFNWRVTGATVSEFTKGLDRHLLDYKSGENFSKDVKIHHLAHMMAGCAILLDAEIHGCLNDDRPKENIKTIDDFIGILKGE